MFAAKIRRKDGRRAEMPLRRRVARTVSEHNFEKTRCTATFSIPAAIRADAQIAVAIHDCRIKMADDSSFARPFSYMSDTMRNQTLSRSSSEMK